MHGTSEIKYIKLSTDYGLRRKNIKIGECELTKVYKFILIKELS